MKPFLLTLAALLLMGIGYFAGQQTSKERSVSEKDEYRDSTLSSRTQQKALGLPNTNAKSGSSTSTSSPKDLAGLLSLVNHQQAFNTSTKLRAALGDLGPGTLEDLLAELIAEKSSHPGYYTLRLSLLNHLVVQDPFRALDFLLIQDNRNFKSSSLSLIIQAAAQTDLVTAQAAVARIQDKGLKKMAESALLIAPDDASSEELLDLLSKQKNQQHAGGYPNFYGGWNSSYIYNGFSHFGYSSGGALAKLAEKDLGAAENYARDLKTQNERTNAHTQIAMTLAKSDPQGAIDWAKGFETRGERNMYLSAAISAIAAKDPQLAAAQLDEITNLQHKNSSISSIATYWGQKDPQAAIAWIDSLPSGQAKAQAYQQATSQLASSDPLAALSIAQKLPGNTRQQVMPNIISQWAYQDFDDAKNWVTSQDDPIILNSGLSTLIHSWAQRDPAEAARFLDQAPPSQQIQNQYSTLAVNWANTDREAALTWVEGLENKNHRTSAIQGIYQQWANQDPAGAAERLASINDKEQRQQLLSTLSGNWFNQDPEAAQIWMDSLPPDERMSAANSALSSLSYNQPQEAALIYDQLSTDSEDNSSSLSHQAGTIARNWAQHDPNAAAEWAMSLSSEDERVRAYKSLANQWAQYDPAALSQWIDELPSGNPRDQATKSLVRNVSNVDPASAIEWAETIDDGRLRFESIRNTISQWKNSDPEMAREAAQAANITDDQRAQLLRNFE